MKKEEYLNRVKDRLNNIIKSEKLHNFKSQMYAHYIGAEFTRKYSESFLWNNAMSLSSNSAILLEEDIEDSLAIKCFKFSAEIYELFSRVSEKYDREFSNVLAALCYDISGFQANAMCVLKKQKQYRIESLDNEISDEFIELDNYILMHIQGIMLKKIPNVIARYNQEDENKGYEVFNRAVLSLYKHILYGVNLEYEKEMREASLYFHSIGHAYISQILHLMNVRLKMYSERSIRRNLGMYINIENSIWRKYIKLLAFDFYGAHSVKKIKDRVSIFELWKSQLMALRNGLLSQENSSFVVQMPTSAGKTFIAELLILKNLIEKPNKKIVYIAPYRALRNEKERELSKNLSKLGYTVSTLSGSYEIDEFHQSVIDSTDVLIATPEKVDLMLRLDKDFFKNIELLVVDEGHIIGNLSKMSLPKIIDEGQIDDNDDIDISKDDIELILKYYRYNKNKLFLKNNPNNNNIADLYRLFVKIGVINYEIDERANLLEFLIVRLLYINSSLQVLFLSAVMPQLNSESLSSWISNSTDRVIDCRDESGEVWEPTRKIIGNIVRNESNNTMYILYPEIKVGNKNAFVPKFITEERIRFRNPKTNRMNTFHFPDLMKKSDVCAAIAIKFIDNDLGNCLLFAAKPKNALAIAASFANYIKVLERLDTKQTSLKKTELNESYYHAKTLYGEESNITICLKYGIGIHYGRMYESVRKSVEDDFKNNRLRCLVATNTIGQGVNFPIKNIIIHSLDINAQMNKYLSVRDFWNVAGRAGRAGKETEGQILFVTLTEKDHEVFKFYTAKKNIEPVESSYMNVIQDMVEKRISDETYMEQTAMLTEPFLLDLLSEEYFTSDDVIVEKICNNSLVKVQVENSHEMKEMLYKGLSSSLSRVRNEVGDLEVVKKYARTGFHIRGNKVIENFIDLNYQDIQKCLMVDDHVTLLKLYIRLLYKNEIKELKIDRVCDITLIDEDKFTTILFDWISGKSLNDLEVYWQKITRNLNDPKFEGFIEEGLLYRYPWGITAFLEQVLIVFNGINVRGIPNIINLATFLKCGINDLLGCYLYSLGMKSRVGIKIVCNIYRENNSRYVYDDLIKWLINMNINEIKYLGLNKFDEKDLKTIISQLSQRNIYSHNWYSENEIIFDIKGIEINENRKKASKKIRITDNITYKRDYESTYDPYLIQLYFDGQDIGRVPSEFSKYIATEIDLNESEYIIHINHIKPCDEYNNINITMKKK